VRDEGPYPPAPAEIAKDAEIAAMWDIAARLERMDDRERERVLAWVNSKYDPNRAGRRAP